MRIPTFIALAASFAILSGCGGGNKNATLPEIRSDQQYAERPPSRSGSTAASQEAAPAELDSAEQKKGFLSRIVGGNTVAGYGWDGQHSSVATTATVDIVYNRATTALRNLDFVVNSQQSQYRGANAQLVGARKSDATQVFVYLATKQNGNTEIKVKVGALGDRSGSERILDEIQRPKGSAR